MDIHNYKRRLERTLENIKNSKDISDNNKKTILKFHDSCFADGISVCKIERYLYDLARFSQMLNKDFENVEKDDLLKVAGEIEKKEWSPNSKQTFKVMMKKFYKWLEGNGESYPEKIKWLKTNLKNNHKKLPDELINEEEIEKLIRFSNNIRDRTFISLLYETGCRIGELGSLTIKDISFDEFGAKLIVSGKTGARIVRIVNSAPYIQEWINNHPFNKNQNSYIWIKKNGESISYARLSSIIKKTAKRAGITKRIHPHLFRHSRASYLANYITESQMKNYLGWTQSSKMAGIYVHLNDTDNAILRMNGLKKDEEKQEQKLKPKTCIRCKTINETTNRFCKLCGFILDADTSKEILQKESERNQMDDILNEVMKDKDVLELLSQKIKEKKLINK
ncbi:Tyrosine recombinase XerA [uncultured archaeon]|nr:Tyrosine recombinase XerA [uncultured archaeon]